MEDSNTYGSLAGYVVCFPTFHTDRIKLSASVLPYKDSIKHDKFLQVGLLLRLSGGEPLLHMKAFIHYPMYTDGVQYFPFRTMSMLSCLSTLWYLFQK